MGKYAPLTSFLRREERPSLTLGFAEIEEILGFTLPASAYKYAAWWSNSAKGQSQSGAWREAGWETSGVDLRGRKVTFRRRAGQPVVSVDEKRADTARARRESVASGSAVAPAGASAISSTTSSSGRRAASGTARSGSLGVAVHLGQLAPQVRRLLESRARHHGRQPEEEVAAILQAAVRNERERLIGLLSDMRHRTRRAGAFDLLEILGRACRRADAGGAEAPDEATAGGGA